MISTLTLSAVSYSDVAIFAVLGVCLILGILGGVSRALKGFFLWVAVVMVSLLLVGATVTPICRTQGCEKMTNSFVEQSEDWGEIFNTPIYIADDGSRYVYKDFDGGPTKVKVEDAADNKLVNKGKAHFASWVAERFITDENQGSTLAESAATMLTTLIMSIVMFIVYCLSLGIICFFIRRIFKSMHRSDSAAAQAIDRILGAVVAVGLALIFIMLVLAILHTFANKIPSMHEYLAGSPVFGKLYEANPMGKVLTTIFGGK